MSRPVSVEFVDDKLAFRLETLDHKLDLMGLKPNSRRVARWRFLNANNIKILPGGLVSRRAVERALNG